MTPGGTVLNRYSVGGNPTVDRGRAGRTRVGVGPGANKLVWFDATAGTPTAHDGPTGAALRAGGDRRRRRRPDVLLDAGLLAARHDAGGRLRAGRPRTVRGEFYDLAATNGKLYAPDFGGDAVLRIALGST